MRIAVRTYGQGDNIDGFGGGEQRWTANLAYFLKSEGHEVVRCNEGQDSGCDVFFDASWERCARVNAPHHVHFSYFGYTSGMLESACFRSGQCNVAVPYRLTWNENRKRQQDVPHKFNLLLIPQPYPDNLLPAQAGTRGFNRSDIFWATKDNFHPNFAKPDQLRPDGREHVFIQGGLDTLRSLIRLQKKAEFKVHFLLKHHLDQAPERLKIPQLLDQIKDKEFYNVVPWSELVGLLSQCKLNVPVGGLWGSIPETIFANSMPLLFPRNQLSGDFGTILPHPENADEQDIYEAMEALWFNEKIYQSNFEVLQGLFKDHRTDGLRVLIQIVFEHLGL